MSIENTFQSAVRLCEGYLGLVDQSAIFFEETAVSKLSDRLQDDLSLRKFFVANSFSDLFRQSARKEVCGPLDIDSSIHKFVRSTYIFPDLWCSSHDNSLMKFFIDMCTHASRIFGRELDRDFQEVCQKAEDLGIFIPIMRIEEDRDGIHLVAARTEVTFGEQVGIFYKISEALFELWIKHEDKGKMLEAWSYNIIKKYFAKTNYIVFPNLHIRQDRTPEDAQSLDELASRFAGAVPGSYCDYEMVRLLDAEFGLFLVGHSNSFKNDQDFENIHVIPGIIERTDFPKVLIDFLDSKCTG